MSRSVTITVRLTAEMKEQLDALARATDRSRAYLASQAIREYLDTQRWQIEAIAAGIQEADRGDLVEHEEVRRRWGLGHADPVDAPGR